MKIEKYTYPDELYYDQRHAYAQVEGDTVVQGVTDLAQELLGEVFFVELPHVGRQVKQGQLLFSIQPMALRGRVRRFYAVVSGEVVAVNTALAETPHLVNGDPYSAGWILRIRPH
ncbi:MAG: glycine cleavage system protein H, partial [Anaerolineae bacterium]|nr:glycine cleavage system protein H [Anaerolineae bacterium]